ncbi:MAG: urea ABC transporter permease subunit UrtC [Planctomycetaceae bacterium]|nr:urea ABC transporter permease subunit UrtC [Planctomycetaceae bacterium]
MTGPLTEDEVDLLAADGTPSLRPSPRGRPSRVGGWRRRIRRWGYGTFLLTAAVVIPALYWIGVWTDGAFGISIETVNMLGRYLALAMVALSLDLLWGYTGMLCLCQSFFFSLGGYAMGMYLAHHGGEGGRLDSQGWNIPACLYYLYPYKVGEVPEDALTPWFWKPFYWLPSAVGLGLLIPGLVALVIGFFVFRSRVRGVFFAVLTQAITLAAWLVFCMNDMKLCGTNGLTRFDQIGGFPLYDDTTQFALYLITLALLVGIYLLCRLIVGSRLGRVLMAIRDNETRLRFAGYKPYTFKVFVFSLSAMIAGLAGMLYAPQMKIFTPTNMEVKESIEVVVWVAVGGRGTLTGPVAGALVVNLLKNKLTSQQEFFWFLEGWVPESLYTYLVWKQAYWPFVLGALFIVVVRLLPGGLAGLWRSVVSVSEGSAAVNQYGTRRPEGDRQ